MKRKFWNWVKNEGEETRTLYLTGEISDETWFGDEVTPKIFKDELMAGSGDITLWINSPGGDVFAAAQIYNMLMDYPGQVTVKIDGLAASAASVIAMAGSQVEMSPVAMMMIHNPITVAIGDSKEMQKAIDMLSEVKGKHRKRLRNQDRPVPEQDFQADGCRILVQRQEGGGTRFCRCHSLYRRENGK
jgi:ATP-dependent Clp protease protease subunit